MIFRKLNKAPPQKQLKILKTLLKPETGQYSKKEKLI